jgi:hypothetical protein
MGISSFRAILSLEGIFVTPPENYVSIPANLFLKISNLREKIFYWYIFRSLSYFMVYFTFQAFFEIRKGWFRVAGELFFETSKKSPRRNQNFDKHILREVTDIDNFELRDGCFQKSLGTISGTQKKQILYRYYSQL